jgi:hypothetical protein
LKEETDPVARPETRKYRIVAVTRSATVNTTRKTHTSGGTLAVTSPVPGLRLASGQDPRSGASPDIFRAWTLPPPETL